MVLELLMNPRKAEREPWEMFFVGLVYSTIALFLSWWIFGDHADMVMVFLTCLACIYIVQGTIRMEEKKDVEIQREVLLLKEHSKALAFFMFLFLGFVVSYSLWYMILPGHMVSSLFKVQADTIDAVNSITVGGSIIDKSAFFSAILLNNVKVLFFCLLFAFFYGAGSVFILAWNASVVGTAIGQFFRSGIAELARSAGLSKVAAYFSTYSMGIARYMTHGVFEILAYFMAALGGGIISIAVMKHDFGSGKFKHVMVDSIDLIILSMIILIFAAFVEAFITPLLF